MSEASLKNFITQSLIEISEAVSEAAKKTKKIPNHFASFPRGPGSDSSAISDVKFDLAVTISDSNSGKGGGSAGFNIHVVKANLGADVATASAREEVSRITFAVPICFAVNEEK